MSHQLERVINAIESIVHDDFCEEMDLLSTVPEALTEREKIATAKLGEIYKLSHAFNRSHSCHRVHDDWRARLADFWERPEDADVAEVVVSPKPVEGEGNTDE